MHLSDPEIRASARRLEWAEFTCAVERGYHPDLRTVQRHLYALPHNLPPDYVAAGAVRRLFGLAPGGETSARPRASSSWNGRIKVAREASAWGIMSRGGEAQALAGCR